MNINYIQYYRGRIQAYIKHNGSLPFKMVLAALLDKYIPPKFDLGGLYTRIKKSNLSFAEKLKKQIQKSEFGIDNLLKSLDHHLMSKEINAQGEFFGLLIAFFYYYKPYCEKIADYPNLKNQIFIPLHIYVKKCRNIQMQSVENVLKSFVSNSNERPSDEGYYIAKNINRWYFDEKNWKSLLNLFTENALNVRLNESIFEFVANVKTDFFEPKAFFNCNQDRFIWLSSICLYKHILNRVECVGSSNNRFYTTILIFLCNNNILNDVKAPLKKMLLGMVSLFASLGEMAKYRDYQFEYSTVRLIFRALSHFGSSSEEETIFLNNLIGNFRKYKCDSCQSDPSLVHGVLELQYLAAYLEVNAVSEEMKKKIAQILCAKIISNQDCNAIRYQGLLVFYEILKGHLLDKDGHEEIQTNLASVRPSWDAVNDFDITRVNSFVGNINGIKLLRYMIFPSVIPSQEKFTEFAKELIKKIVDYSPKLVRFILQELRNAEIQGELLDNAAVEADKKLQLSNKEEKGYFELCVEILMVSSVKDIRRRAITALIGSEGTDEGYQLVGDLILSESERTIIINKLLSDLQCNIVLNLNINIPANAIKENHAVGIIDAITQSLLKLQAHCGLDDLLVALIKVESIFPEKDIFKFLLSTYYQQLYRLYELKSLFKNEITDVPEGIANIILSFQYK